MIKYKSYVEFEARNQEKFKHVQEGAAMLKSPEKLGSQEGHILAEAETLEHAFLKLANFCTDLSFGLSASVLDAKANVNNVEGELYGLKVGGATDKNRAVACDPKYMKAQTDCHELEDLKKYLENKREDFMANHYFYKAMRPKQ